MSLGVFRNSGDEMVMLTIFFLDQDDSEMYAAAHVPSSETMKPDERGVFLNFCKEN